MATAVLRCRPQQQPGTTAGVVAPPPLIFALGLGTGLLLDLALPPLPLPGTLETVAAIVLGVAGAALAGSFVMSFRRAGTPVDPGQPTRAIVTSGPYRLTRNPGYLGMTCAYVAICLATGSLGAAILLLPTLFVIDCGVIRREEAYLVARFGEEYDRYRARVRRWL